MLKWLVPLRKRAGPVSKRDLILSAGCGDGLGSSPYITWQFAHYYISRSSLSISYIRKTPLPATLTSSRALLQISLMFWDMPHFCRQFPPGFHNHRENSRDEGTSSDV